ncbi:MAG: hypothetical protein MI802_29300 [Desulfobacterales bacterium]|nr:hypothetical protein [Desulfobacterales bacterium]
MKPIFICLIVLFLVLVSSPQFHHCGCGAALANPFTTKPGDFPHDEKNENQSSVNTRQPQKSQTLIPRQWISVFVKWQLQLREKMSALAKEFKATGNIMPMMILLGVGFLYGTVHAAGPGHGKAVALSYILAAGPGPVRGLAFGNILAFTHGISGILLVLGGKYVFQTGISGSLDNATLITQTVSYSLIILLGLFLVARRIRRVMASGTTEEDDPPNKPPAFISAVTIGLIPCPGVVMAMLFAVSMGMPFLGAAMGLSISAGMAVTLSGVVLAGISGRTALLAGFSRRPKFADYIELILEIGAALIIILLGTIFLLAS